MIRQWIKRDRLEHVHAALARQITGLTATLGHKPSMLDYGCGKMEISERLSAEGLIASLQCVDLYPKPEKADPAIWGKYQQLSSPALTYPDARFDLAIVTDVLHHAGMDAAPAILAQLARCARYVLVKDHFEHGPFSRQLLRLADCYGNWASGVHTRDRYFTKEGWQATVGKAGLEEIERIPAVKIHSGIFGLILPPRYHFIALLRAPSKP